MKSVILAGGSGVRLKEVTKDVPKHMAMIAGKPFLEHQIQSLRRQNIEDIILCVQYKADVIKSYFGDGTRFGVNITYSEEETPLGTAGAVKKAEKYIDDTFFVLNGDSYSQLNLNDFLKFHKSEKNLASITLANLKDASDYNRVTIEGSRITNFLDGAPSKGLVSTGIYLFEPEIFDFIEPEKESYLEKTLFPRLAKEGKLNGYIFDGYFMDIKKTETYEKFKEDFLQNLIIDGKTSVREAMQRITENSTDLLLISDSEKKLLGVLNDKLIKYYLIQGGNVSNPVSEAMIRNPDKIGKVDDSEEKIHNLLLSGARHLPIVNEQGQIKDVRFRNEEIKNEVFPVLRGRAPLRISFAGGGTDLPYFFEKYGGVVISSTINKYCHATIAKRADSKIKIDSDMNASELIFDSKNIIYDGNFDIIKSIIKVMKPDFGMDISLHNEVPPGRGLGSSASLSVLISKLIAQLQGIEYDDSKIAEMAYKSEREEMGVKGGWQDQYAAAFGGFNYMEFNKDKTIIYPLRLKESTINELSSRISLCYVGNQHYSGALHKNQERAFAKKEGETVSKLNRMKEIAIEIKDSLLMNRLDKIGGLLHESWENKKEIDPSISNPDIDRLYFAGRENGANGGKLLGAGGGGYIMFYHPPEKRNKIIRAIKEKGGEMMDFNFDVKGVDIWSVKNKFY